MDSPPVQLGRPPRCHFFGIHCHKDIERHIVEIVAVADCIGGRTNGSLDRCLNVGRGSYGSVTPRRLRRLPLDWVASH
jgi:hypothetical protein